MKLMPPSSRNGRGQRAWALLAVMTLSAGGLMVLAGVMNWADQNSANTARNNEYFTTSYAAEAATEKALAQMSADFQNYGLRIVDNNLASSTYSSDIPTSPGDGSCWSAYQFTAGSTANQLIVTNINSGQTIIMGAPYTGLTLLANTYEVIATARNTQSMYQIPATIGQQVYFGTIPLFQFAIFYQDTLEMEPNAPMTVNGPVHGNSNIYLNPSMGLTFSNSVTASGNITTASGASVTFDSFDMSGVDPLDLPVGTNATGSVSNSSDNVHAILNLPTAGQTPNSQGGSNLLYNQADMIILINADGTISVTSGAGVNNQATAITNWQSFLSTNGTFNDQRDASTVNPVTIDVSNLVNWSATNNVLRPVLASLRGSGNADVQSIYVDDLRSFTNAVASGTYTNVTTNTGTTITTTTNYVTNSSLTYLYGTNASPALPTGTPRPYTPFPPYLVITYVTNPPAPVKTIYTVSFYAITKQITSITNYYTNYYTNTSTNFVSEQTGQPGVVLSNGAVLPPQGLAIATPDPAYIIGDWNIKNSMNPGAPSDKGLSDTSYTLPSAIYSDAITVLSSAWNPANSALSSGNRIAADDTVNAAFLTGNVATSGSDYSGGVENLPRLLENWSGKTLTYNGSMVCMFQSQIATAPYPGTATGVFTPPARNWSFDQNFSNPNKQPPLMPRAIVVQRNQWVSLPPNTTSF